MEKLYLKSKQAEPFSIKYISGKYHMGFYFEITLTVVETLTKRIPTSNFNHCCQQDWEAELYKIDIHNPHDREKYQQQYCHITLDIFWFTLNRYNYNNRHGHDN